MTCTARPGKCEIRLFNIQITIIYSNTSKFRQFKAERDRRTDELRSRRNELCMTSQRSLPQILLHKPHHASSLTALLMLIHLFPTLT